MFKNLKSIGLTFAVFAALTASQPVFAGSDLLGLSVRAGGGVALGLTNPIAVSGYYGAGVGFLIPATSLELAADFRMSGSVATAELLVNYFLVQNLYAGIKGGLNFGTVSTFNLGAQVGYDVDIASGFSIGPEVGYLYTFTGSASALIGQAIVKYHF